MENGEGTWAASRSKCWPQHKTSKEIEVSVTWGPQSSEDLSSTSYQKDIHLANILNELYWPCTVIKATLTVEDCKSFHYLSLALWAQLFLSFYCQNNQFYMPIFFHLSYLANIQKGKFSCACSTCFHYSRYQHT